MGYASCKPVDALVFILVLDIFLLAVLVIVTMKPFLWLPYVIGRPYIFLCCGLFVFFFLFFPRLISAVGDWMSTLLPHMVWP